jgi:hypothetical protein
VQGILTLATVRVWMAVNEVVKMKTNKNEEIPVNIGSRLFA